MIDTLSVTKEVYMASNLSVSGFTDLVGRVQMDSTLSVKGATTLIDTLSVTKEAYLASNLSVSGFTDLVGRVQMDSTLSVKGATTMVDTLSVTKEVYLASNLSVTGFVDMVGRVQMESTLSVKGSVMLNSTLSINGNAYLGSQLSVNNHVELASTLSVLSGVEFGTTLSVNTGLYMNTANGVLYTNYIKDATTKNGGGEITIDVENLKILGNIEVAGTYNTTDIETSQLIVEDTKIILATSSTYDISTGIDTVEDSSSTNDGSGIKIAGKPSASAITDSALDSVYTTSTSNMWEKSLLWNNSGGMPNLGYLQSDLTNDSTLRDNEPFWEMKGGAFHLTGSKFTDGIETEVKYGFRINANGELEIIKREGNADSKRVAKFGITSAF
jgi:hypothetical protein